MCQQVAARWFLGAVVEHLAEMPYARFVDNLDALGQDASVLWYTWEDADLGALHLPVPIPEAGAPTLSGPCMCYAAALPSHC